MNKKKSNTTPKTPSQKPPPRRNWQLTIAVVLTLAGIILLFLGFLFPPEGEIHHSVLIAFGEVSTFAGALFGVDYSYRASSDKNN